MKAMKKFISLALALMMLLGATACGTTTTTDDKQGEEQTQSGEETPSGSEETTDGGETAVTRPAEYVRGDDETIYEAALGKYEELNKAAKAAATTDEKFVLYAQAEAYLLDSAVMSPYLTQGGAYTISRVAYRTVPYVMWGNDEDRLKSMVVVDNFITKEDREALKESWSAAVAGTGTYDPVSYLTGKGYSLRTDYKTTFSTAPVTLDWLNTSSQSDTEITVNVVDGLVEYNNLGQMIPALAESWTVSDDGLTYTFKIREGVYWYTSEGAQYAEVTAEDFEAGFQHMLDAKAGLEWLIDGVIVGGTDYYSNGGSWDNVGYKATDKYTLTVTLEQPTSYFMTMLTYSCFLPICKSFYLSRGGALGVEEYAAATATDAYTYGLSTDVASQVYCGAFLIQKLEKDSEIDLVANPNYWNLDSVRLTSITWIYDNGENPTQLYKDVVDGVYAGVSLGVASGTLALAMEDGNYEKYAYVSDTTSTSYMMGLNVNRGTFALESGACATAKTEDQKIDTQLAMLNQNFRKAILYAFDRGTFNAVTAGEDLKYNRLRNMYTHPEFVQLSADTTDAEGHTFAAGTLYGEMVQYYCDKLGLGINVSDGVDGWYNADKAVEYLNKAIAELGDSVSYPIILDVVYYSASTSQVSQTNAFKQIIEGTLGADKVQINLIEATTSEDYYACGYRATSGEAGNFDIFYGSGWAPDYGDPCSYLDTFLGYGAGYMTKISGLF